MSWIFQPAVATAKRKIMLNLTTQHKLGIVYFLRTCSDPMDYLYLLEDLSPFNKKNLWKFQNSAVRLCELMVVR